ncbi:MAG: acyl-CoA dehydrogenase family protein [Pseudomonadota bacterium]
MPLFEDNADQRLFRQEFRKFCAQEITPHVEVWERDRAVPRELWKKMGEQGYLCPWLPEEYGGLGLDFSYSVIISEELIRADGFGVGVPLHSDVVVPYIFSYGSKELRKKILPGSTTGKIITCIGLTEPNTGSDLAAIRTKAVKQGDHYLINGQKTFITNGIFADVVVLAVRVESFDSPGGISLIVVENDTPGFSRGRKLEKMGYHMQDTAELFFEDCRVPAENLLGEESQGFKYMMEKLVRERLGVCVICQAMAEECLKEALSYAKVREAFGRTIGSFQHNAFKLAEMATEVDIGRTYLNTLVTEYIRGDDIVTRVSMAKAWLGEMVNRVAYQAVQLHGGYGYMEEYRISRLFRDARCLSIFAGTTEIMNLIISRRLGLGPV